MNQTQSYDNHGKMVPLYHYVGSLLLLILLVWHVRQVILVPTVASAMGVVLVFALLVPYWFARAFALGVQDRVIRLEERLRLERLLDGDMRARIGAFTTAQLIGLRFASDAEVPALARRVLQEGITDRKAIKRAVKDWRADHQRI